MCYFGKPKRECGSTAKVPDVRSCSSVLGQGKCFDGTESRASSLADQSHGRGISWTTPEKTSVDTQILQHALGRAPDRDGRFYTPEYESLPTVQAELLDETHGNNIKRMQDSEVNFLRWTYQNRVSRALNSKSRKAQVFLPGTYVYFWRKDKRETKQRVHLKALVGASRPGVCVWLSRAGRLMRADPTQLRLASGREEAYQELHDSHPMPWTARGELQKLQKGQFWTSPQILQKMMKIRGRTHLETRKQTLSKHKHKNSSLQGNDFS